jgi:hypothetical protein
MKQLAQIGPPSWSRVTGSRRARQREHSSMRECAMQVRQTRTPLSGLSIRTTRWQPGHVGRTMPAMPAACRRSTNLGITRSGARCPSPGEQGGIGLDGPSQFLLIGVLATGLVDRCDRVPADLGVEFGDNGVDHRYRITVVDVAALSASWLSVAVEGLHALGLPAAGAGCSAVFARALLAEFQADLTLGDPGRGNGQRPDQEVEER